MNTISLAAKDAIYNLGMEIGSIPTKVELGLKGNKKSKSTNSCDKEREELLSSLRKQVKRDQEELSRMKKSAERKAAESKAAKEFIKNVKKDNNIQEVSDALKIREKKAEEQKANNTSAAKLSKAEMTKKWLEYATYYMSILDAQLLNLTKSQEGLVNGIAKYFSFGKIYEDAKISDIETFDKSFGDKYDEFSRYEISIINDIVPLLEDKEFMKKVQIRKQQLSSVAEKTTKSETTKVAEEVNETKTVINETTEQIAKNKPDDISVEEVVVEEKSESVKNEDIGQIIHPISFETLKKEEKIEKDELETELKTATSESIKEEELKTEKQNKVTSTDTKLNPKMFKRLENIFVPLIGKKNHKYEIHGDLINLHVYRKDNIKETFVIDPGVYMGKGKIYVLTNMVNDKLPVSTEHKDIIRKVLSDSSYVLSANEAQKVLEDYFRNTNIYRYIDMNKTEFLSKINEDDFQKLGKKLTFIINQTPATNGRELPRFRFLNWESVDKFTIISDSKVKSPLSSTGETSDKISEGLTYIVEGDYITQKMGDKTNILKIQQYGDM